MSLINLMLIALVGTIKYFMILFTIIHVIYMYDKNHAYHRMIWTFSSNIYAILLKGDAF